MAGYTPVFSDIYSGTLYGRWPAAAVWASILPLFDRTGRLDMSYQAIAGMTGWPIDLLKQGIGQLMEADPESRSRDAEGCRLMPLEEGRDWGWVAVNHAKYAEKARLRAKSEREVESGRNAQRLATPPPETAAHRRPPPETASSSASASTSTSKNLDRARQPPKPPPRKRCPTAFEVDLELQAWAAEQAPDVDWKRETANFRDYEFKTARTDWPATWRSWMRRSQEHAASRGTPKASRETITEKMARMRREANEEEAGQ